MILLFLIVDFFAHQHPPDPTALSVWTWICHHVVLTILILLCLA